MTTPDLALQALADPSRRRIVQILAHRSLPVHDLLPHFDFSQPALSKHLRILRHAGLVSFHKLGRVHHYHLNGHALHDAAQWMLNLHAFWQHSLDQLTRVLDEENDTP